MAIGPFLLHGSQLSLSVCVHMYKSQGVCVCVYVCHVHMSPFVCMRVHVLVFVFMP